MFSILSSYLPLFHIQQSQLRMKPRPPNPSMFEMAMNRIDGELYGRTHQRGSLFPVAKEVGRGRVSLTIDPVRVNILVVTLPDILDEIHTVGDVP